MENLKKINTYTDKTFGGIEFTSSADILIELLCENKMSLLSLIAQKKIINYGSVNIFVMVLDL